MMTNEDKILAMLEEMKSDITELKQGQVAVRTEIAALRLGQVETRADIGNVIVTLGKNTALMIKAVETIEAIDASVSELQKEVFHV
jgi:prefoldin subunit 5